MFFFLVILAALETNVDGVCIDTCLVDAARSGAKQWHDYWTQRKRAKPLVYNDSLHSMALVGAKKVLEGKPHGIETSEFCTYYMTLDTYWHTWENSYMQKLFNMLPFNNIGYVAQKNPGAPYGCAFHAVFADGRHSDYYGDKKILLCTYKISNSNTCDPDERRYDPKTIPDQVQIDFTKNWPLFMTAEEFASISGD